MNFYSFLCFFDNLEKITPLYIPKEHQKITGIPELNSLLVGEKTYAATLFTSDRSAITRELDFDPKLFRS